MRVKRYRSISVIFLIALCACKFKKRDLHNVSFKDVIGINYTEVRRRLYTGRSFDAHGYEVDPEWRMSFLSKDSSSIFSPDSNRFLTFPVTLDHDSLFNTGNTWLRAKKVTKDSMIFQVMDVKTNTIYLLHSNVYMTFYSNDYIKNHHLDLANLQKTDRADTAFVRKMAAYTDQHPDSLFAAKVPPVLKSKSPYVLVEKEKVFKTKENHADTSDSYMDPKYFVTIHHAYKDCHYLFTVYIDGSGNIIFRSNLIAMIDFKEETIKTIKGIIDGYLKAYINVTPGNTLGITHTSLITLDVTGRVK